MTQPQTAGAGSDEADDMDVEERELFVRSLRHAVESAGYTAAGAEPDADTAALDAALGELGWAEALDFAPREAIAGLAEVQGEHTATSTALHRVVAHALTGSTEAPGALLPSLGTCEPPGRLVDRADEDGAGAGAGPLVEVRGLANAALLAGGEVTIAFTGSDGSAHWTTAAIADLQVTTHRGLDPAAALATVSGTIAVPDLSTEPTGSTGRWDEAVRRGRLFVAHELQGASASVLAQAREHALDRIQFGQPIAGFQAVRHKLAEVLIATETAAALLDAAWIDGTDLTASMAKAATGRAGRVAIKHGQQVLAGIGFTTEHGLHRWVRRVLVLDELLGSTRTLTKAQGTDLLASRELPPLLPL